MVQPVLSLGRYATRHPLRLLGIVSLLAVTGLGLFLVGIQLWAAYHLRAARDCLERYHTSEAPSHLEACRWVRPKDPEVLLLMARTARRIAYFDKAEEVLNQYEALHGADDALILERMLLRAERGDIEPVSRFFQARVEQQHPDTPLILEALTQAYLRSYRLRDAEECLNRWQALQPNNVQALLLRGTASELRQQRGEAASYYRKALEIDPLHDDARFRLAGALVDLSRAKEALPHLEYLRQRLPDRPDIEVRLARCKELLGNPAEAMLVLDDLLARHPDHAQALGERGRLALEAGRLEEAETFLRRAVALDPSVSSVRFHLHTCLNRRGKAAEAKEEADRLKTFEEDMRTFVDITTVRMQKTPKDPALHYQLAQILLRGGQVEDAVRWLQSALRLDPNYAPAHQLLASYYLRIGNQGLAAYHHRMARPAAGDETPAAPPPSPSPPKGGGGGGGGAPGAPRPPPRRWRRAREPRPRGPVGHSSRPGRASAHVAPARRGRGAG